MSEHLIRLIGGADNETATAVKSRRDGLCHVAFPHRGRTIEESATDYFEAFCPIRLRLEEEKLIPFCYGASLNVYPSGMCRDMGAGSIAYRLKLGAKPTRADLVQIFAEE